MAHYLCTTCGSQFAETAAPPAHCPICDDERQYVGWGGQQWTTLDAVQATHHHVTKLEEPHLTGIGIEPKFAIGERALLIQSPGGNVLWDCIPLIDEAVIETVRGLGGLSAIAISHPHYYTTMVEWSRAFGNIPIYLHAADRQWVMRPDPAIVFWEGETQPLGEGLMLIRCGGHFAGGTVLHWAAGAEGRGSLLTGDIIQVANDRRYVSFMYSYPNYIPLNRTAVQHIVNAVAPFRYDRIHGAWFDSVVQADAQAAVARSATRYLQAIEG